MSARALHDTLNELKATSDWTGVRTFIFGDHTVLRRWKSQKEEALFITWRTTTPPCRQNFRLAMEHVDAMMQHGHITDISQLPTTAEMMSWLQSEHSAQPFTWLPPPPPRSSSQPSERTNVRLEGGAHVFSAQDDLTRPGLVTGDSTFRTRGKYDPVYGEQSLAKGSQIGYRSALLHGTTKERWERGMTGWT